MHHESAKKCYSEISAAGYLLITSDYVFDEVITTLFRNVNIDSAIRFVESLYNSEKENKLQIERVDRERFNRAWLMRKQYRDKKDISFTDLCTFIIMRELGIRKAFTGDAHLRKLIWVYYLTGTMIK